MVRKMMWLLLALVFLTTCAPQPQVATQEVVVKTVPEIPVQEITLRGPLAGSDAEISGMAWYGDWLILLPQYPKFDGSGHVYALSKTEIESYLTTTGAAPLKPQAIPFDDAGLSSRIEGFEGYEAIAFVDDQVYLTVEANTRQGMRGYLVRGQLAPDLSELVVETAVFTEILPQTSQNNHSDETLLVAGDNLLTIYEVNGTDVNEKPVAHRFNLDLSAVDTIPLPNIEYRVTDATDVDENGRFWVANYFYPGDTSLQTESDALAEKYGWGATHLMYEQVERLVELQLTPDGIRFSDTPPLLLALSSDEARNWEGIVRLNDGFLLATDKFPKTILGYIEKNN